MFEILRTGYLISPMVNCSEENSLMLLSRTVNTGY